MNKVILIGRLTKDPDERYTQAGSCITSFTLAVDRRIKQGEQKQADFIPCVAFGKTGEAVAKYVSKGHKLAVEGRVQVRSYDGQDGKKWVTEVVVESVDFIQTKGKTADNEPNEDVPF